MFSLKKNVITIFLLIIVYVWFFISHSNIQQKPASVLGTTANISVFTQPETGRAPIVDAINSAQKEILAEVYLLSDKDIISALENAKNRGLVVDVMLEQHPFGGGNLNNESEKELLSKGVSVSWTNPSFSLTHEKTIVIDGSEVFILNQNLTASSFSKNREYDVLDTNLEDVSNIRSIFIDDWQRKQFTISSSNLVVSPNNSRSLLTGIIQNSSETLDIEIEDINDNQVVSMLSDIAKKVKVRLIVPTVSQVSSNKNSILELSKNGVMVKTLSSPYIHAKLILSDNNKAYVGSVNLSTQSLDKNREVGLIISKQDSLQTFSTTFENDWEKARFFN